MKLFTAKLRQLIGAMDHPVSWAPRNLLFEAQRHFLERLFDSSDIRGRGVKVEVPDDGGPILFKCEVSLRDNPHTTISHISDADWGDFDVKAVRIRESDEHDLTWLAVAFVVDLRDARYPNRGREKWAERTWITGESTMKRKEKKRMERDNAGVPPCLGLSHENERKTGAALRMWLHPAAEGQPGNIALSMARQSSHGRFDWWNSVYVQLGPTDLAKILMVFTGWLERTANDGAGMDNTIRHTLDNGSVVTVDLSHKVDPYPSYCLSLVKRGPGVGTEQVQIELSDAEALAITEAIRGAMPYVAFGVPRLEKEEE